MRNPLVFICFLLVAGCDDQSSTTANKAPAQPTDSAIAAQPTTPNPNVAPNNSATNKRDDGTTVTPLDQGKSPSDLNVTTVIRKRIMDDKTMSVDGQNVKIITVNGTVTLRGPVDSVGEKDRICELAKSAVGDNNVDNQIEVKAK